MLVQALSHNVMLSSSYNNNKCTEVRMPRCSAFIKQPSREFHRLRSQMHQPV